MTPLTSSPRRTPGNGGRPARGFTLVELMIAIGITASIAAMVAGSFAQVDRASQIARAQGERFAVARLALSRMAREISMAFLSDHFDRSQYRERPTLFLGREDELLFSSMAHVRLNLDAKESDQSTVEYGVEHDPERPGTEALFRREKPRIDDEPDRGGRNDVLCDRVRRLEIQYWDRKRQEWVREWSTRSTERANELPTRVRVELELEMPSGGTEKFSTETRIAITRPRDDDT